MSSKVDWDPVRALTQQVLERGEPLELSDDVRALLRRSAREVAIPTEDVKQALRSPRTATALLRKIRQRLNASSRRFGSARSSGARHCSPSAVSVKARAAHSGGSSRRVPGG